MTEQTASRSLRLFWKSRLNILIKVIPKMLNINQQQTLCAIFLPREICSGTLMTF